MTDAPTYEPVTGLDINDTDTVLRNVATGRLVKVRVLRLPNQPWGHAAFLVSGAACDARGRALPRTDGGDGFQIAPAQTLTVQTDASPDLKAALDWKRRVVAAATERAIELEEALSAL
jgi:hypothetical protein